MKPSDRAIAAATDKITYAEEKGEHIVKIFGTRYRYDDQISAIQARERLIALLASELESFAAEVQALNAWLPTPTAVN